MFFEKEIVSFKILDVLELKQKNVNVYNYGRDYNALSFRFKSDAVLNAGAQTCSVKDKCVSYVPAGLNYGRSSTVDEMIVIHFYTTDYHTQSIEFFEPKDPRTIAELFRKTLELWNRKEIGYKYECSALLYRIFAECHVQNCKAGARHSKIQGSVDHILKNYKDHKLSMGEIARKSFMSEVYFRRLFKEEYGVSPQKFIIDLRMKNAVALISAGYYSLKEVALMSGYSDYKYFSVEFKKYIGMSPSQYISSYGEKKDAASR